MSVLIAYFIVYTDYPNPPTDLRVIEGPGVTSVGVEWVGLMELHIPGAVVRPTQGYVVEVRVHDGVGGGFVAVETLPANVTFVNLDGLFPGTSYDLRVLATNLAGSTPSDAITITTNSSGLWIKANIWQDCSLCSFSSSFKSAQVELPDSKQHWERFHSGGMGTGILRGFPHHPV